MGYALSWTAVRGKAPELVLAAHELRPTGKAYELPDRRTPFCWGRLEGGWILVASSPIGALEVAMAIARKRISEMGAWHDPRFLDESDAAAPFLASLSAGCELVGCFLEEHAMVSRAVAWRDGVLAWSVLHDGQREGVGHLAVAGEPPAALSALASAARAQQQATPEGVDFLLDVPIDLARAATGFRHDDTALELEVLAPTASAQPAREPEASFLRRLFRRRGPRAGK